MSPIRLFHVSEEAEIVVFHPRPVPSPDTGITGNAVWAVDEMHLPNYLLPRDCPRVTFANGKQTSNSDRERFLLGSSTKRVIAVESNWFSKIKNCQLYLYELPKDSFEMVDSGAGYYISRIATTPISMTKINDLVSELLKRNIELRFLPNLWSLRNTVVESTLEYSIIRFRNALPPA